MPPRRRFRRRSKEPLLLAGLLLATATVFFAAGYYLGSERARRDVPVSEETPVEEVSPVETPPVTSPRAREFEIPPSELAPSPPEPWPPPAAVRPGGGVRVALVIDDLGRRVADVDQLEALDVPISYGVLPFESRTSQVVEELRRRGAEYLCHLPMEASNGADPGPGALTRAMSPQELAEATRWALDAVAGAVGVNNHMGSAVMSDPDSLKPVLGVLAERRLFFLDSRTSADTRGYRAALDLGIPAAERQVFLDPESGSDTVRQQFRRLLDLARQRGAAIAIGHPHTTTLGVLEEEIPVALAAGYEFVPVSYLLDRRGGAPR